MAWLKIIIVLIIFFLIACIAYGTYGTYGDWGDYELAVGDLLLLADEKEVVWYNDSNTVSIRASELMAVDYYMRWPLNWGEPNSVLMTPGVQNAQLVWAIIDTNQIDVNWMEPNTPVIGLPVLTPGSRIFVDVNGYPLFEDNDNAYFDDINDFAGFALGHIAASTRPNNYIQVYKLLNFDPNLYNTSVGWSADDVLEGPNNVRFGYHAGRYLTKGKQNALGGRGSGERLTENEDNAFWGYQTGKYVETAPVRDEATVIANGSTVTWLDSDYNVLDYEDLNGPVLCTTVDVDPNGIVVAGYYYKGTSVISRWDADLNRDANFFVPTGGWPSASEYAGAIRFTDDGDYLYAVVEHAFMGGGDRLYKFDAKTGAEEWHVEHTSFYYYSLYVDSNDNAYIIYGDAPMAKVFVYDSDGNKTDEVTMGMLTRDMYVDDANNRIYVCGKTNQIDPPNNFHSIAARDLDGSNFDYYSIGIEYIWGIIKYGNYIYAAGNRTEYGYEGAWASVYKFDTSLNIVDSYDTGTDAQHVWIDWNNNIVIKSGQKVYLFDTELNKQSEHPIYADEFYGNEGHSIPFTTGGLTHGSRNTAVGSQALKGASAGAEPNEATAGGYKSMYSVESGDLSSSYGAFSGYNLTTGSRDLFLGSYAGYNQTTADDLVIIDNGRDRGSITNEQTKSLMYGTFDDDPNNQTLRINATVIIPSYGGLSMADANITASRYNVDDSNSYIDTDGSNNLTFTDSVTGTKTLAEIFADPNLIIDADSDTKIQTEESADEDYIRFDANGVEAMVIDPNQNVGMGTAAPTAKLDVNSDIIRLRTSKTVTMSTDPGNAGDMCWDSDYFYVCVSTNSWKRTALSSWETTMIYENSDTMLYEDGNTMVYE